MTESNSLCCLEITLLWFGTLNKNWIELNWIAFAEIRQICHVHSFHVYYGYIKDRSESSIHQSKRSLLIEGSMPADPLLRSCGIHEVPKHQKPVIRRPSGDAKLFNKPLTLPHFWDESNHTFLKMKVILLTVICGKCQPRCVMCKNRLFCFNLVYVLTHEQRWKRSHILLDVYGCISTILKLTITAFSRLQSRSKITTKVNMADSSSKRTNIWIYLPPGPFSIRLQRRCNHIYCARTTGPVENKGTEQEEDGLQCQQEVSGFSIGWWKTHLRNQPLLKVRCVFSLFFLHFPEVSNKVKCWHWVTTTVFFIFFLFFFLKREHQVIFGISCFIIRRTFISILMQQSQIWIWVISGVFVVH